MSIVWELTENGTLYSVRQAGESVRLYSNRVFHSQWNPDRPMAGAVWDCLSLPSLYRAQESLQSGVLLGVGGGAVLRQLELLRHFNSFTGIELDEVHIDIAHDWFGVKDEHATLVHDDAVGWLWRYTGDPFDLVIDDLFGHDEHEPVRAQALTQEWVNRLAELTSTEGVLVVNCIDRKELYRARPIFKQAGFASGVSFSQAQYDNHIGVFSRTELNEKYWQKELSACELPTHAVRVAKGVIRRKLW